MYITCCHNCEKRHEKCHSHCEDYHTQKILKILVEAKEDKERRVSFGIKTQRDRQVSRALHEKHLKRRK